MSHSTTVLGPPVLAPRPPVLCVCVRERERERGIERERERERERVCVIGRVCAVVSQFMHTPLAGNQAHMHELMLRHTSGAERP